jgi:hypothetical protein
MVFVLSTLYSCPILTKLEFSLHIFKKSPNIKFHEIRPMGAELFYADEQNKRLIAAFHNFANAPKKSIY